MQNPKETWQSFRCFSIRHFSIFLEVPQEQISRGHCRSCREEWVRRAFLGDHPRLVMENPLHELEIWEQTNVLLCHYTHLDLPCAFWFAWSWCWIGTHIFPGGFLWVYCHPHLLEFRDSEPSAPRENLHTLAWLFQLLYLHVNKTICIFHCVRNTKEQENSLFHLGKALNSS